MKQQKEEEYTFKDIIKQCKSFLFYLRKKWLLLLLFSVLGAGLGLLYYKIQKPKYVAVTTFILEERSGGGGGLAGLASQFGFNLGGLAGGGSIFSGDNILSILKSKKVVQKVLLTKIDTNPQSVTLADYYLDFSGTRKAWREKPKLTEVTFGNVETMQLNPLQDSILNVIYENIIKKDILTDKTSKQGSIIKVQVTSSNSLFARLMTERLLEEASSLYLEIRVGTAQENIRHLQRRSDSLLALLNNRTYRAAASQPLDVNPGIRTAAVPVEIATRDKTVAATIYAEVTKNLEASKMLLSQQTPVIQLLDRPGMLLDDNMKSLPLLVIGGAFISGFLYIAASFVVFLFFRIDKAIQS